jgi:CRISPR-associated endonuclease/helicase Cas3
MDFWEAFAALTEKHPFPWQERAFELLLEGNPPQIVTLPTGTAKTSLIPIWIIALAFQAKRDCPLSLPRQMVWAANRRVVVDQATDKAASIISRLEGSNAAGKCRTVLNELRTNLSSISILGLS